MTPNSVENKVAEANVKLPLNSYRLRCIECKSGKSKKGSPQLTQTFEVFGASPIVIDGHTIDVNGVKVNNWATLQDNTLDMFNQMREALDLPPVNSPNAVLNELEYKGREGAAICVSESLEMKNEVTGEPIINPNNGQPVIQWSRKVKQWLPR